MPVPFGPPWTPSSIAPANPGAGNHYVLTVPAGSFYHVVALTFVFTTSATAGNRFVNVSITDAAAHIVMFTFTILVQTASLAVTYDLAPNFPSGTAFVDGAINIPLPDCVMPEGWKLTLLADGMVATDAFSAIGVVYESLAYV